MIPFNKPYLTGNELKYIAQSLASRKLSGDGTYSKKCAELMQVQFEAKKILLTTSCTHALELSALALNIKPGDEFILPSYTFVTTANSFVLRGAKPVFVDICPNTMNIDANKIKEKITSKTKAIIPVHYAGVSCEMDKIMQISEEYQIPVVEDAAQGVNAKYKGKFLGTLGTLGCYSFHETKNYVCGVGGAIIINSTKLLDKVEIIREKGTDRSKFLRGEIDKYSWVDKGSSYLPSDLLAACLYAQLESLNPILEKRKKIYDTYKLGLESLITQGIKLPHIPKNCESNYHMFYLITHNLKERTKLISHLRNNGIHAVFHYVPLHTSTMGQQFKYKKGELPITEDISSRLVRLPLFPELTKKEQDKVITKVTEFYC